MLSSNNSGGLGTKMRAFLNFFISNNYLLKKKRLYVPENVFAKYFALIGPLPFEVNASIWKL